MSIKLEDGRDNAAGSPFGAAVWFWGSARALLLSRSAPYVALQLEREPPPSLRVISAPVQGLSRNPQWDTQRPVFCFETRFGNAMLHSGSK